MAVLLGDVNGSLQHQGTKGDAGDPADESDYHEDGEDQKDNAAGPVVPGEHVDGGDEAEDDVEDAGDPDELLGEDASEPDVSIAEGDSYAEAEDEEDNGIGGKAKGVCAIVDATAIEAFGVSWGAMLARQLVVLMGQSSTDHIPGLRWQRRRRSQRRRLETAREVSSQQAHVRCGARTRIPAQRSLYLGLSSLNCWSKVGFSP